MNIFNLSLDDMSSHPQAGLNFESIYWCEKLIVQFPDIKINLFVPAKYARLGQRYYDISSYSKWAISNIIRSINMNNRFLK